MILTTVIDSVYSENHDLTGFPDKADKLEEGKALIATISRLKYDMARDRVIEYVVSPYLDSVEHYLRQMSKSLSAGLFQLTARPS